MGHWEVRGGSAEIAAASAREQCAYARQTSARMANSAWNKPFDMSDATHGRNATCPTYAHRRGAGRGSRTALESPRKVAVALISFTDSAGVRWRAWQVETPAARAHLMEPSFRSGWLVFEREDGEERRRFSGVPDDWTSFPPERLAELCAAASPAVAGRTTPTTGQQQVWSRPDTDTRTDR